MGIFDVDIDQNLIQDYFDSRCIALNRHDNRYSYFRFNPDPSLIQVDGRIVSPSSYYSTKSAAFLLDKNFPEVQFNRWQHLQFWTDEEFLKLDLPRTMYSLCIYGPNLISLEIKGLVSTQRIELHTPNLCSLTSTMRKAHSARMEIKHQPLQYPDFETCYLNLSCDTARLEITSCKPESFHQFYKNRRV